MIYKESYQGQKFIVLLVDIVILYLSIFLAYLIRLGADFDWNILLQYLPYYSLLFVLCLPIFYIFELYNLRKLRNYYWSVYALAMSILVNLLIALCYFYILNFWLKAISPITILLIWAVLLFVLMALWRFIMFKYFATHSFYRRVGIIGANSLGQKIAVEVASIEGINYQIVGFIASSNLEDNNSTATLPVLGGLADLKKIIEQQQLDVLVMAFDYFNKKDILKFISDCLSDKIKVLDFPIFYEQLYYKVPTENIDHFWFLYNVDLREKWLAEKIKRIIDIFIALVGLIFVAVLTPLIALIIRIDSVGPIFYRQKRVGFNGKKFMLYKFRTMKVDAERDGAVWAKENDDRVTRVGKFLRQTRIDELPQFLNILKGDMSLVGPRPERPEFVEILNKEIPFYYKRHIVRPGVTGWAQVMYPYAASIDDSREKVGYDLYYIKNRSLFLYFMIILRTIRSVFLMKGR